MTTIPPAARAEYDRILAGGVDALLKKAAAYDGRDIIEANVAFMSDLLAGPAEVRHLAAATAALALRLHRSGGDLP